MTGELEALLRGLEERLRQWGAPVVDSFRPGAPPDHIRRVLAAEGLGAPGELVTWFAWHDGAEQEARVEVSLVDRPEAVVIDHWYVISLVEAVQIRRWQREDVVGMGAPELMPETWFPVLHFTGAAYLCADTGVPEDAPAPVYIVDPPGGMLGPPPPDPPFASLTELVGIIVRFFDAGLVSPDPFDARLPSLRGAPLEGDVKRLLVW